MQGKDLDVAQVVGGGDHQRVASSCCEVAVVQGENTARKRGGVTAANGYVGVADNATKIAIWTKSQKRVQSFDYGEVGPVQTGVAVCNGWTPASEKVVEVDGVSR